nr:AMP-dependent synthetase ligase domain containing protein [Haemonchus contortus]
METVSVYPTLESFDLSKYTVTVSMDETPSNETDSVDQDEATSVSTDEVGSRAASDVMQPVPVTPTQLPVRSKQPRMGCKSLSRWLFSHINNVREKTPEHVALIDETGERQYVTYGELVQEVNRAANFLLYHGIVKGSRVAICMGNSIEFIYFELALFLIGAVPILLNPGHVASGRIPRFQCTALVVDAQHYNHVLRSLKNFVGAMQVFCLTKNIGSLSIPRHVWIIDAFEYRRFQSESSWTDEHDDNDNDVVAFSTSGATSQRSKVVAHNSASAHRLCTEYLDMLTDHLEEQVTESRRHHLLAGGLHTVDSWSLLMHSLTSDHTVILMETSPDFSSVTSLDRIAELIQLYDIALVISQAQFLKCFLKYDLHKSYDISSLKVFSYSGTSLPISLAKKFQEINGTSIFQVFSSTECGPISYNLWKCDENMGPSDGRTFNGIRVKIADIDDEEKELPCGEWGRIMLQTSVMCSRYLGDHMNNSWTADNWFRTGDIGMLDDQKRLHVAGPNDVLLRINDKMVITVILENALMAHSSIEDVVVASMSSNLAAGVVLREGAELPTVDDLNNFLQDQKIETEPLSNIIQVNFIPRSETGKVIRSEVLFLLQSENDNRPLKSGKKV